VQRAAAAAKPGETVYVMSGELAERVKSKTGGTKSQSLVFVARPRRSATVSGFDREAGCTRVEGFEITAEAPATADALPNLG
jgi:hypothetical protein